MSWCVRINEVNQFAVKNFMRQQRITIPPHELRYGNFIGINKDRKPYRSKTAFGKRVIDDSEFFSRVAVRSFTLIRREYAEAAKVIAEDTVIDEVYEGTAIHEKLSASGVLDLWYRSTNLTLPEVDGETGLLNHFGVFYPNFTLSIGTINDMKAVGITEFSIGDIFIDKHTLVSIYTEVDSITTKEEIMIW